MWAHSVSILPVTSIIRKRTLPVPGTVLVKLNQRVAATEVIAEATIPRSHLYFNVARLLGLSPLAAAKATRVRAGEQVAQNGVLAESGGLFPRQIRSPKAGRVILASDGEILIEVESATLPLLAGMPGVVTQVIPTLGAVIQTNGALIQGVFGNGRVDTGLLINLMEREGDVIEASRLDLSFRGAILLAGQCRDAQVLRNAAEIPVRGLILSSLLPNLIPLALQMKYPIIVTDGLWPTPMNPLAFKLLSSHARREITLNAQFYNRRQGIRPEIVIPLPVSPEAKESEVQIFAPGQTVFVLRAPYAGQIGQLVSLLPEPVTFPGGISASAAEVRLENGEQVLVPLANMQIVG
ncbi:MAG: hypothetical protein WHS87_10860 [Anaerolineales bacterium]